MVEEVVIGPFTFEIYIKTNEMAISSGEDHLGTIEHVWPEVWEEFVIAATRESFSHAGIPFH